MARGRLSAADEIEKLDRLKKDRSATTNLDTLRLAVAFRQIILDTAVKAL